MLAMIILPMAVAAVAYAVVAGHSQEAEAMRQTRAAILAEAIMEEALSETYDPGEDASLGPEAGESGRDEFDSPNDYHGLSEAAGSVTDATGNLYPEPMQRYSRSVSCSVSSVTVAGLGSPVTGLQVEVTVSDGGGPVVTLTRFIADPPDS
jgi:hypothetical protein